MSTGHCDGDNSLTGIPSSQVTLVCTILTKAIADSVQLSSVQVTSYTVQVLYLATHFCSAYISSLKELISRFTKNLKMTLFSVAEVNRAFSAMLLLELFLLLYSIGYLSFLKISSPLAGASSESPKVYFYCLLFFFLGLEDLSSLTQILNSNSSSIKEPEQSFYISRR